MIASTFCAFSVHLSVLGTHTVVNSFLSPFVIFAITPILERISSFRLSTNTPIAKIIQNGHVGLKNNDSNGNIPNGDAMKLKDRNACKTNGHLTRDSIDKQADLSIGKDHGSSYLLPLYVSGCVLGLSCYIRIDVIFFISTIILSFLSISFRIENTKATAKYLVTLGVGLLCGISIGGLEDYNRYGQFFLSPIQWYNFNLRNNVSGVLFGRHHGSWYLEELFYPDIVTGLFYALSAAMLAHMVIQRSTSASESTEKALAFQFICSCLVLLFAYSLVDHKELRFVHNVDVILIILMSCALHRFICFTRQYFLTEVQTKGMTCFIIGIFILNSFSTFPSSSSNSESPWIYKRAQESADVNQCLDFIGSQDDVTGLVLDSSLYFSGGMAILNKDVPLVVLIHAEYHVYDPSVRPKSQFSQPMSDRLRIINRFSDYIYGTNVYYLTRLLYKDNQYNYIVTNIRRIESFGGLGYNLLFRTTHFAVLYRKPSAKDVTKMKKIYSAMPVGKNATILEYEGSWLFTAGLYDKAVERLETAIEINSSRWRPYQLLGMSYVKLENWQKAKDVELRCFRRHSERKCRSAQDRIVLNEEYNNLSV